jgi:hypothetical protein
MDRALQSIAHKTLRARKNDKIEVGLEMIKAGQIEFALSEGAGDDESIAAVYVAMEQARRLASGRKRRLPGSRRRSPE